MGFSIEGKAMGVASTTIGLVVVLAIFGSVIGDIFTNLGTVMGEFALANTGNTALDAIIQGGLALLAGVSIVFGIVKLLTRSSGVSS